MRNFKIILKYRDIFYYHTLQRYLSNCDSVLDIGCGEDSPLGRVKKNFYSEGVDIFEESLKKSKKNKIHDKYVSMNILKLGTKYKEKSFDAVIALDVIEHFKKGTANKLIKDMEKIAKKKVILLTPNGFYKQDHINGNPHQIHHSGWSSEDLESLSYKVVGLRGLKYLKGDYATIKYKPWLLWALVSFVSEPLLHYVPKLSYHLFAVRKING